MFGGRGFAAGYFAQAGGPFSGTGGKGRGVGGSGFPADWLERMFGGNVPAPYDPEDDIAALLLLELL